MHRDGAVTGQTDSMRSAELFAIDERDPPTTPPWMTKNKLAATTGLARKPHGSVFFSRDARKARAYRIRLSLG